MTILFGHPTGNPNSHHAALAHLEAGRLEAMCVPWMPTKAQLAFVSAVPGMRGYAQRLARRRFEPLAKAPLVQGRIAEWRRMIRRVRGGGSIGEGVSYEANDWLMRTMARECRRPAVTAVHAYEDCSLWQFEEARRRGQACIYDLPIGYWRAWQDTVAGLRARFADWLPSSAQGATYVRPEQKAGEMALADRVLVPGSFVARTVRNFEPAKEVHLAPYGVDAQFWRPRVAARATGPLRFVFAGQLGLRKGTPLLLKAWRAAGLRDAQLHLVGPWHLADARRRELPTGIVVHGPLSPDELRAQFQLADAFVFPSYFEGFGLVLLEAMACGLPAIASDSTAGPDVLVEDCGRVVPTGDLDALVAALRDFAACGDALPRMGAAARARAEACTWDHYRRCVQAACAGL